MAAGAVVLFSATWTLARPFYRIALTGDAQIFSIDRPAARGAIYVFHRYPDGIFTSIPAREVLRITALSEIPSGANLSPGETLVLGPTGTTAPSTPLSPGAESTSSSEEPAAAGYGGLNPAYLGYYGYVAPGYSLRIGRVHGRRAPATISSDGFPILGWKPPLSVIGTDGFPEPPSFHRNH
jgi:hypothetical protein